MNLIEKAYAGLGDNGGSLGMVAYEPSFLDSAIPVITFLLGLLTLLSFIGVIFLPARIIQKRLALFMKSKRGYWSTFGYYLLASVISMVASFALSFVVALTAALGPVVLIVANVVAWLFSVWIFFTALNHFLALQKLSFKQKYSLYWPVVLVQILPLVLILLSSIVPVLLMGMAY